MYKKYLLPLLAGALFTTSVSPVQATDTGTISFTGRIVADTCEVHVNGATTNGTVTFRNISQTAFGADKKVGDSQPFTITVRNCDSNISFLNIKFNGDRITGYDNEVLQTIGSATNVGIRILPAGSPNYIKFDGTEPLTASKQFLTGSDTVFNYTAEVIQVGSVSPTAGEYNATAAYTLTYR
jgi:major type 1 subunit fimbrin (pilin)